MKLAAILSLILIATPALAAPVTVTADVDPAACAYAAQKHVAGQCDRDAAGQCKKGSDGKDVPKPAPTCKDFLAEYLEGQSRSWAEQSDRADIERMLADPAKRAKVAANARAGR